MNNKKNHHDLVIGLGEIGKPLKNILEGSYSVKGRDIEKVEVFEHVRVLHLCYPYISEGFIKTSVDYINEYRPELTMVHSTVVPGTMQMIFEQSGGLLTYSPMRGKHTRMQQDLMHYTKFIAGATTKACEKGLEYLSAAGFKVRSVFKLEALELAKIIETTYFGLLVSWAQEVERMGKALNVNYEDALLLTDEVSYLPPVVFQPGYIGGHCIMPNIELLEKVYPSPFLDLIKSSNEIKKDEWIEQGKDLAERIAPIPKQ